MADEFISIGESLGIDTSAKETPQEPVTPTPEVTPAPETPPPTPETAPPTPPVAETPETPETPPEPQSQDPFIAAYQKAKEQGMSHQEFIQQQNVAETIKTMPSREFLIQDLLRENGKTEANPNGWDQSKVEEFVDGMNEVQRDLAAKERKGNVMELLNQESEQYQTKVKEKVRTEAEKVNSTTIKTTVEELFSKMAPTKDIGGIPHTPEDQAAFKQMFADAVSINPETGYSRTRELFSNDEVLYKALYLYNKVEGDNSLRGFLSNFKEEYKQEVLDKTRIAPREEGGSFINVAVPGDDAYV